MMDVKEFNDLIWNQKYDEVKELVNSNIEYLELEDEYKRTPVYNLSYNGNIDMLKFFIEKGANINSVDKWGETALYQAASNGHLETVKYLIDNGADVNIIPQYTSPLISSLYDKAKESKLSEKEIDDLAKLIIDKRDDLDYSISTLLNRGKIDLFKNALETTKVSEYGILNSIGSMYYKGEEQGFEILRYILDNNFLDINSNGNSGLPLFQKIAYETKSIETLEMLIERGVDINKDNNSNAILTFANKGFKKGLEYLVEKLGVDVNYIETNGGNNALHKEAQKYVSYSGEEKLSESFVYLVEKACDLTLINTYNKSILYYLAENKRKHTIKYAFKLTAKAIFDKQVSEEENKDVFESLFSIIEYAPTKKEKEYLVELFMSFPQFSSSFVDVINDPKLKIREMAVKTLISFNQEEHLFSLRDRAKVETNKALLKVLKEYMEISKTKLESLEKNKVVRNPKEFKKNTMEYFDVMAENEDGNIPVSWLKINELPDVLWEKTNEKMEKTTVKYLVKKLKDNKVPSPFIKLINSSSLVELFNILHEMPKKINKDDIWIYNILFMLAEDDSSYLKMICEKIDRFVNYSRWALGTSLFTPMANMKNPIGIKKVDWYERKVKHKGVSGGAYNTLRRKASLLNMTLEEFRDTLISDFGFSKDKELILDYGTRKITVKLMPDFKYTFKDDNDKTFKTLPKPNKKDKEKTANKSIKFFKEMKKEIKDILKIQKERIEAQFKVNTLKEFGKWESFYVKNPVLNIFASNLFWGIYDDKGKLKKVFRYNEDHTFSDINDDDIKFKKTDKVGLLHPVDLKEKELNKLKELIEDYEIIQPLEQVARKFFVTDSKEKELTDFENLKLYTKSSHYKLLGLGWERGYIVDNGWFEDYRMMTATLDFSGADMYLEYGDETVTWGKVRFGKTALNKVNKRTYSEVYRALDIASQTRVE